MKNGKTNKTGFAAHVERAKQIRTSYPSLTWNEAQKCAAALRRFETLSQTDSEFVVTYVTAKGKEVTRLARKTTYGYMPQGLRELPAHQKPYWDMAAKAVRSFVDGRLIDCRPSMWD